MERQYRLAEMPWPKVKQAALQGGSTVVWPFGAVEQHGPHLPLGTDGLFDEWLVAAVLACPADDQWLGLRPLPILGFPPYYTGFACTLTLEPYQPDYPCAVNSDTVGGRG